MNALRYSRLGIRGKLGIFVGLLLGALCGTALVYFPASLESTQREAIAEEANTVARLIASSLSAALVFDDAEAAREVAASARDATGIAYVIVTRSDGHRFVALGAPRLGVGAAAPTADTLHARAAVVHRGTQLGTVHVGAPLAPMRARVAAARRDMLAASTLTFLLAMGAVLAIGSFVTRPLRQMVDAASRIAAGEVGHRAATDRDDEAGELARAFNHMLDRLAAARHDLERLNEGLEERVAARTRELEQEVAERRRTAEELRTANDRFTLAASAVEGAVYDFRVSSDQIEWSDGLLRIFGHPSGSSPSPMEWWQAQIHPEDRERVVAQLEGDIAARRDFAAEYRFAAADGSYRHVLDRGRFLYDAEGAPTRMVGIVEDVTKLRQLEEQFHHAQRMEAVGRLAGGVAHDFNNLLTAIIGYSDLLLLTQPAGSEDRASIEEIRKAGERAAALTQKLLAFSRRQVVAPKVVDVNHVLVDLSNMLARLLGETVSLHTALAPVPLRVLCDPRQLEQVIVNLGVNARDAMPAGGTLLLRTEERTVSTSADRFATGLAPGSYVALVVQDTGIGMDAATRSRIFEPFFTTKPAGMGTGLGLPTVYGIVQQAGGQVLVESEPGRGSTFTILLPRAGEPDADEGGPRSRRTPAKRGKELVLVVEDEDAVRNLAVGVLRSHGYRVLAARDAEEALKISDAELAELGLVVTDVVMPKVNGRELVDNLRKRRPRLQALMMSGYTDDMVVRSGISLAETPFLEKPFLPDQLLAKVRELLDAGTAESVA